MKGASCVFATILLCTFGFTTSTRMNYAEMSTNPTAGATVIQFNEVWVQPVPGGPKFRRYTIDGSGPQFMYMNGVGTIRVTRGLDYNILYQNNLNQEVTLHQHGMTPPENLDGVPYISQVPIGPNRTHYYRFKIYPQNIGTYFVHSHFGFQEQLGLAAPVIIDGDMPEGYPNGKEIGSATDVVMYMEDFCAFSLRNTSMNPNCFSPMDVYRKQQQVWAAGEKNYSLGTCMPPSPGLGLNWRHQFANKRTLADPIIVNCQPGELIRLRVVMATADTAYRFDFPFEGTIIAVDGQVVVPLKRTYFWAAVAQRFDVVFRIPSASSGVYPVFARQSAAKTFTKRQAGIILRVGGAAVPKYPMIVPASISATIGMMGRGPNGIAQELLLSAWFPLSPKPVDKLFQLHLTGNNGHKAINNYSYQLYPLVPLPYKKNPHPVVVSYGDRACIKYTNFNGDAHPMHLHGHSFQVVELDGHVFNGAMRDTLLTPMGRCKTATICFDALNPGMWPLHCHITYHLAAGMLTTVEYDSTKIMPVPAAAVHVNSDSSGVLPKLSSGTATGIAVAASTLLAMSLGVIFVLYQKLQKARAESELLHGSGKQSYGAVELADN